MTTAAAWRNRIVGSGEEAPAALVANPRNWRTHSPAQVAALAGALDAVGWVQQVIVNRRSGLLVDGHARVAEAARRNEAFVPVVYVDLDEQEEALVLATLDPIGAMAGIDQDRLRALLDDVVVDDDALRRLLGDLAGDLPRVGRTDPDDAPDVPESPYVALGELWALGDHRLLCGDASAPADVARLMAGQAADCVWTDPPYGVAYVGKTRAALRIANDDAGADALVGAAFGLARELVVGGAPFYCAAPAGPGCIAFGQAIVGAGWRLHQELVWVKDDFVLGHSDYHYRHEPVLYGYAPGPGRPGRGRHAGSRWYGNNAQASVLEYGRPQRSAEHPTMKPEGLVAQCIRNSTPPGGRVLDLFAGSGTTVIAAEQLGLRAFAMEIDPRYAQVAIERWQAFTGRTAERVDG